MAVKKASLEMIIDWGNRKVMEVKSSQCGVIRVRDIREHVDERDSGSSSG
jgi:hypothetical protein